MCAVRRMRPFARPNFKSSIGSERVYLHARDIYPKRRMKREETGTLSQGEREAEKR